MKRFYYYCCIISFFLPVFSLAQQSQPVIVPKDAPVDVTIADTKSGQMLNHEIVIFRSKSNGRE